MRKQNNEKPPVNLGSILIRVAAGLFCLLLISVYLLGGLFARYVSRGQGADSARVAKFDVRLSGVTNDVTYDVTSLAPGQITISLDNQSEVAVAYSVRVNAGMPKYQIQATVVNPDGDDGTNDNIVRTTDKEQNITMDFGTVGYMAVGGQDDCTLAFTAVDWEHITQGVTGKSATVQQSFTVYVDVVQVD